MMNRFRQLIALTGERRYDLFTFFCLYIAQSLPMTFFSTALQVSMRQASYSLSAIALMQLIKLPWILKFLWAPWVDRGCRTLKGFRKCIFVSEGVYALLILLIGHLDLQADFRLIIFLILLSFVASATQDIATDALAVLSFRHEEKSLINSMQSLGSFCATLVGSGVLLILLQRYGWHMVLPFLAVFVGLALWPLYRNRGLTISKREEKRRIRAADFYGFFTVRGNLSQIGFLMLYYASTVGILSMTRPWLVDLGYSMKEIGFMSGIIGSSAACASTLLGGHLVYFIGRFRARRLFALFSCLTAAYFALVSNVHPSGAAVVTGIVLLWAGYAMSTVVVYTTAMDRVRPGLEGTDFTIQTVITHLSGILVSVLSGHVAEQLGYRWFFAFATVVACLGAGYVFLVFRRKQDD
ncbi:MFS transporter [Bacteroides sp. KG123]|uniref:MFS transporter n=1 Tax=unclassified Bacteroides TaxID=2646097 RepID=UPI003D7F3A50